MVELAVRSAELRQASADPETADETIENMIADLGEAYDEFTEDFGELRSRGNQRAYDARSLSYMNLTVLEELDEDGLVAGPSELMRERVIFPPRSVPEHVDDPEEALRISLDERGGVDVDFIAGLLNIDADDVEVALSDYVVHDPDTDALMMIDDYVSGNVREKLNHVRDLIHETEHAAEEEALAAIYDDLGISELFEFTGNPGDEYLYQALVNEGVWESYTDPLEAKTAVVTRPKAQNMSYGWEAPRDGQANTLRLACLTDLKYDAPFDPDSEELNDPHALLKLVSTGGLWGKEVWEGHASFSARMSTAAVAYAFAHNGGKPEGYMAYLFENEYYSRAMRHRYGRYASAVCRFLGMGQMDEEGFVLKNSVEAKSIERALVEHPEVSEYLLAKTIEWCRTSEDERLRTAGRNGEYTEYAYLPNVASSRGLIEYARRRYAATIRARQQMDETRLVQLRALEQKLEQAVPERIDRKDISLNLGSPWIPATVVLDFLMEKVINPWRTTSSALADLSITNDDEVDGWSMRWNNCRVDDEASARYGVHENGINAVSAFRVVQSALRNGSLRVTKTDPDNPENTIVDEEMTMLAWDKRAVLEQDFQEWCWADPKRAKLLEDRYNEVMNSVKSKSIDGSYLTLPGSSPSITLRAHQLNAISRVLRSEEGTLLAHAVGAGKTFEGIAACHEAKRLGKANKPLVAVPNGIVAQWGSAWQQLYPTDRILVMGPEWTRNADTRQQFWQRAAEQEWDGIIVPHSRFDEMTLGETALEELRDERVGRTRRFVDEGETRPTYARRRRAQEREMRNAERDLRNAREGITFDTLGVDMMVVDEAHNYKNLNVYTTMNVAGIPTTTARKSRDLLNRCDWMRLHDMGGNIVFLTGTPVTNSMSELYAMQRYLAPRSLEQQHVGTFDLWALNYGRITQEVEVKPEGGLQVKDRFSRFTNLPELMAATRNFCDLVTDEDLDLDLPDVKTINVDIAPTEQQRFAMEWLGGRGAAVRGQRRAAHRDNLLAIITDGRKVAIDPKLLYPDDETVPDLGDDGKIAACARNVFDVWQRTKEDPDGNVVNGTQLVFCDSSTDANAHTWNAQANLADKLYAAGIPREQVAIVSGKTTPSARENIFAAARAGSVRVIIGSTATLGTGVSVQDRLAAIHDLDCPWRSSDLEQRLGRIRRQGNQFTNSDWWQTVDYRYATIGTFDSFLYQTTERKAHFVSQVMTNNNPLREAPDLSDQVMSLSEMKALVSGDPNVRRRLELENEVNTLRRRRSAWSRETDQARRDLETEVRPRLADERMLSQKYDLMKDNLENAYRAKSAADSVWLGMDINGVHYEADADGLNAANEKLYELSRELPIGEDHVEIGSYQGMKVYMGWHESLYTSLGTRRPHLELGLDDETYFVADAPVRTVTNLGGAVRQIENEVERARLASLRTEREVKRLEAKEEHLTQRINETWSMEEELRAKAGMLEDMPVATPRHNRLEPPSDADVLEYLRGDREIQHRRLERQRAEHERRNAAPGLPQRHRVLFEAQRAAQEQEQAHGGRGL